MLPAAPPDACSPSRVAPASTTPRSRSGQHSYRTAWHAQRSGTGRAPAAASSSTTISIRRWTSWGCIGAGASAPPVLQIANLRQPPDVPRLAHRAVDECVNDRKGLLDGEQGRAEGQDVGAIVLPRVARERRVEAHRGADTADLVRRNARTQTRAVDDDADVGLAARDLPGNAGRDVRIIHRIAPVGAEVVHCEP